MNKRIISLLLIVLMTAALLSCAVVSTAAAGSSATIIVGGKSYTAAVGDNVEYAVSFRYSGKSLSTAQIELPVDLSILNGYTQQEMNIHMNRVAPNAADSSVALRHDNSSNTLGLTGYVLNFAAPNGVSFSSQKVAMSILFRVEKAGTYTLAAKVRHVDTVEGQTVVDKNYNITDSHFSYTESLSTNVMLDTPAPRVSAAAGGMSISWDAVPRAAYYRVYYKGSKGWTKLTDTTETSFLDTDVVSGTRYTYTVRCLSPDKSRFVSSYDTAGKSAYYYTAPRLSLSNAEDGVNIKWDAVKGVAKYRVYYKGRNGWTRLTDTTATSFLDTDVSSGTNYTYTIRCLDSSNNFLSGYYTDGFRITFISAPSFSLSNAANGVRISWTKVNGAAKYRVFYRGSNGWTRLGDTAETSFLDTDVSSNHTYTYTVRCINADGSAYTGYFRAGKSIKYIAAPQLSLTNAADGVNISWNAVSGAAKYRVYYKGSKGWTRLTDTTGTSFLDTDVSSGTNYTYTIRCMDSSNNLISSYYTDGFRITFISAPQFSVSNAANGVQISWNKVSGAAKYRIFYYGSKGWTRLADTDQTSYIDTDVSSNHTYTYTVRCITSDGASYTSYFRAGKSVKYIAAPQLTLSNESGGVRIKWNAVSGASKYRVYYKGSNGWTKLTDTTSTSYLDTSVSSGKRYTYTIRCMDSNNNHISYFYTDGFSITYTK